MRSLTRLSLYVALLFAIQVGCAVGQAPPDALQDLVQAEWQTEGENLTLWTTAQGDTAYVVGAQQEAFRAHLANNTTWVRCPETANDGDPYPLTMIVDSAEVMLRNQENYGINGATATLSECPTTLAAMEDSLRNN